MEDQQNKNCKNCKTRLDGPYCHACGQKVYPLPWSFGVLLKQFINQLTNVEKGFIYTAKGLFLFPGTLIRDYWNGKTIPYYNPFRYAIIWVTINLLINFWLNIDDMLQARMDPAFSNGDLGSEQMKMADQQFDSWLNFLVLFLIPAVSVITFWLFYKKKKKYAEHLIMNSYILGQGALISTFTQFIFYFFPSLFVGYFIFYFLVGWVYDAYVFNKTFDEKWGWAILKAAVKGIFGLIVLVVLIYAFSSLILAIT